MHVYACVCVCVCLVYMYSRIKEGSMLIICMEASGHTLLNKVNNAIDLEPTDCWTTLETSLHNIIVDGDTISSNKLCMRYIMSILV